MRTASWREPRRSAARSCGSSLIERLPLPALLIDPDTLEVVATSEFAIKYLQGAEVALEGRKLFDALHFSYPDFVQELIVGARQRSASDGHSRGRRSCG